MRAARRRIEARNAQGVFGTVPISHEELRKYARIFQAPEPDEMALFDEPV